MSDLSALVKEISIFVEDEGYKVVKSLVSDWGKTMKLVITKGGSKSILSIAECFYDTDSEGKITKVHGIVDIRSTPWYKRKKTERGR